MTNHLDLPNLPIPPGAYADAWCLMTGESVRSLTWVGFETDDETNLVTVDGVQFGDGRIERGVRVRGELEELTAAQARALARALIKAADRLDELTS
jgi:hypothetical protein